MNYVKVFDENDELKLTILPKVSEDSDAYIQSLKATFYGDDTATEWSVSNFELKIIAKKKPNIEKKDKIQIWHGDECFGDFFVTEDIGQDKNTFTVKGVDSVYFIDDVYFSASSISNVSFPTFIETLTGDFIENYYDDGLENVLLSGSFPNGYAPNNNVSTTSYMELVKGSSQMFGYSYYLPNLEANGRGLVQYAMEASGITATTFKTKGIRYKSCKLNTGSVRKYNDIEVFDGAKAEKKDVSYNNIELQGMSIVYDTTHTYNKLMPVDGIVKANGDTSGDFYSIKIYPTTTLEFYSYDYNGTKMYPIAKPGYSYDYVTNALPSYGASPKGNLCIRDYLIDEDYNDHQGVRMSDFCSVFENFDGSVTYQWDMNAVREFDAWAQQAYVNPTPYNSYMQITDEETGETYLRMAFAWDPLFIPESSGIWLPFSTFSVGKVTLYENANTTVIMNPFFGGSTITDVIENSYKAINRDTTITFKVKYSGENMGDIVMVKIDKKWRVGVIKGIECSFSHSNVFCTITADVLSQNEIKDVYAVYGLAILGKSFYSSKEAIVNES